MLDFVGQAKNERQRSVIRDTALDHVSKPTHGEREGLIHTQLVDQLVDLGYEHPHITVESLANATFWVDVSIRLIVIKILLEQSEAANMLRKLSAVKKTEEQVEDLISISRREDDVLVDVWLGDGAVVLRRHRKRVE
jgi:hypothetical protein